MRTPSVIPALPSVTPAPLSVIPATPFVIPAKAGIQPSLTWHRSGWVRHIPHLTGQNKSP